MGVGFGQSEIVSLQPINDIVTISVAISNVPVSLFTLLGDLFRAFFLSIPFIPFARPVGQERCENNPHRNEELSAYGWNQKEEGNACKSEHASEDGPMID
jgi:hypothetical protein